MGRFSCTTSNASRIASQLMPISALWLLWTSRKVSRAMEASRQRRLLFCPPSYLVIEHTRQGFAETAYFRTLMSSCDGHTCFTADLVPQLELPRYGRYSRIVTLAHHTVTTSEGFHPIGICAFRHVCVHLLHEPNCQRNFKYFPLVYTDQAFKP